DVALVVDAALGGECVDHRRPDLLLLVRRHRTDEHAFGRVLPGDDAELLRHREQRLRPVTQTVHDGIGLVDQRLLTAVADGVGRRHQGTAPGRRTWTGCIVVPPLSSGEPQRGPRPAWVSSRPLPTRSAYSITPARSVAARSASYAPPSRSRRSSSAWARQNVA